MPGDYLNNYVNDDDQNYCSAMHLPPSPENPAMKILIVSWEYPPVVVGGLGRHVHQLAISLAEYGHEVVVLSRQPTDTDPTTAPHTDTFCEGVRIIAAAHDPHEFSFGDDMMPWTLAMGHSMIRAGLGLHHQGWKPDVVHAHDWLVAHAAIALADFFDVPLITTMHATEAGRHGGWICGQISQQVHAIESWLARYTDALITCSASMAAEITELFGPDLADINVIRNGIDCAQWPFEYRKPRTQPPTLLYFGRLEYEKGIHDAIAALPRIRRHHPGTTMIIAGSGTQHEWLIDVARQYRVRKAVTFTGQVHHDELLSLLHHTDVAVLPSHYEPFGIVALEAAATGAPLVTSDVGGLGEVVSNGSTGISCPPKDIIALATAICTVLDNPDAAQKRAIAARQHLSASFDWSTIATQTAQIYHNTKRGNRIPLGRQPIVERALTGRHQ